MNLRENITNRYIMKANMTITEKFDRAKKTAEKGDTNVGYVVGGREFFTYLTNSDWEQFKAEMPDTIKEQYGDGKGSEMKEYTRKGIKYPPKMASYASSSRFMYEMGKDIEGFIFEKQLNTGLGGYPANLDGYIEAKNLFIEAKCHEFYSNSKPELRESHKKLYDAITASLNNKFHYCAPDGIGGRVLFKWDGQDCGAFDLKQMLCHFCGIANMVLKGGKTKVNFIYLIYSPTIEILKNIENESDRKKILQLFKDEKDNAQRRINFRAIYKSVLSFFNDRDKYGFTESQLMSMAQDLNFKLCTQNDFKSTVEGLEECA